MVLKRSWWRLQCFNQKLLNQISCEKIMNLQMCKIHNLNFSRLSFWSYGQNNHFNVISMERSKMYYREEGGGFFLSPSHVNIMNPKENSQPKVGFICTNHLHSLVCACDLFVRCPWLSHHPSPIPKSPHVPFLPPQVHKAKEHTSLGLHFLKTLGINKMFTLDIIWQA